MPGRASRPPLDETDAPQSDVTTRAAEITNSSAPPALTVRRRDPTLGSMDAAAASRDEPLPASMSVRAARDAYLAENGFTVEGYDAKWTDASAFGLRFRVPNTSRHAWAIRLHDLHHVATGFGTDLAGEGEISAWELRRGLRGLGPYVAAIVLTGAAGGLLLHPLRTLRAWRAAAAAPRDDAGARPGCLFQTRRPYDELLAMSVGELRRELGLGGRAPGAGRRRGLHAYAPARGG